MSPADGTMAAGETVTAIVPARDAERHLGEALDSILAQTRPPDQVLVVDDGSTDATASIAEGRGVTCLRQGREGLAAALNAGLAAAEGELIALLDADDLWTPDRLELGLAAFARHSELDIVFGHVEQFLSPELSEDERALHRTPKGRSPGIFKGTMLARRRVFDRVGGFSDEWKLAEFIDWYARAQEAGLRVETLPEVVLRRRLHATNMGIRERGDRRDYARVLGAALRRRRQAEHGSD